MDDTKIKLAQNRYESDLSIGRLSRQPFERDWEKNLLNLFNKPFLAEYSDGTMVSEETLFPQNISDVLNGTKKIRRFIPVNIMFSCYTNLVGRLEGLPTEYICMPLSTEIDDEFAARLAERLLNSQISPELKENIDDLIFWIAWTNTSAIKMLYKKDLPIQYPEMTTENTGIPILRKDLFLKQKPDEQVGTLATPSEPVWWMKDENGVKRWQTIYDGKISLSICSPFELYIDPLGKLNRLHTDKKRPRWIIHEITVSRDEVEQMLEKNELGIEIENISFDTSGQDKVAEILNLIKGGNVSPSDQYAVYREYWRLPNNSFPEGLYLRTLNDKVFEYNTLPEPFLHLDILPFISVADTHHPYSWYTHTYLDKVRPWQKLKSIVWSKIADNIEKTGGIELFSPMGDTIKRTGLSSSLIDGIWSGGNQPPTVINLDKIPMTILRANQEIDAEVAKVFLSDLRYPVDKNQPLGTTMAIIEQDDARISGIRKSIIRAFCDVGEIGLQMMQAYYPPMKQVRIVGDENIFQIYQYNSSDVRGNIDINIRMGELPYYSPSGIGSRIQVLQQLGIPVNNMEVVNMLNMKSLTSDPNKMADVKHAQEENAKILRAYPKMVEDTVNGGDIIKIFIQVPQGKKGEVKMVETEMVLVCEEWEDHDIDYTEHENFLKRNGAKLNSIVVELLLNHMRVVKQKQMQKLVEQAQMIQQAQNAVNPQPAIPPPKPQNQIQNNQGTQNA
jgi:hypothetical protein